MKIAVIESPVGRLGVVEDAGAITRLSWGAAPAGEMTPLLQEACRQLDAYFQGDLQRFDLPLDVGGSDFQREVCRVMSGIPYGETLTYGEIAVMLSKPAQAVGAACGANPIPVIIPCHRVLSAGGLGGFSGDGGVETKVHLLRLEGAGGLLI